jgi:hypothetical protein
MKSVFAAAVLAATCVAVPAHAGDISVISGTTGARATTLYNGPIGQSFTSIDSTLTSIGFQFQLFNTSNANTPFTLQLLNGSGLGGTQIYSTQFTLPTVIPTSGLNWFDVSLANVGVTIGNVYTAVLSNSSLRYGVVFGPEVNIYTGQVLGGDAYAGGQAFGVQSYPNCPNTPASACDLNFRVHGTTATAAVPEPATWGMIILGFGAMAGAVRRRGKVSQRVRYA